MYPNGPFSPKNPVGAPGLSLLSAVLPVPQRRICRDFTRSGESEGEGGLVSSLIGWHLLGWCLSDRLALIWLGSSACSSLEQLRNAPLAVLLKVFQQLERCGLQEDDRYLSLFR